MMTINCVASALTLTPHFLLLFAVCYFYICISFVFCQPDEIEHMKPY
jgi:hypothetical protein